MEPSRFMGCAISNIPTVDLLCEAFAGAAIDADIDRAIGLDQATELRADLVTGCGAGRIGVGKDVADEVASEHLVEQRNTARILLRQTHGVEVLDRESAQQLRLRFL